MCSYMTKFKVGVLCPVQSPGSYLHRPTHVPLVGGRGLMLHIDNSLRLGAKLVNQKATEELAHI